MNRREILAKMCMAGGATAIPLTLHEEEQISFPTNWPCAECTKALDDWSYKAGGAVLMGPPYTGKKMTRRFARLRESYPDRCPKCSDAVTEYNRRRSNES